MKRKLKVEEIHNGWIVTGYESNGEIQSEISFHWGSSKDDALKMLEHIMTLLDQNHSFAVINKSDWARQQKTL